MGEWIKSSLGEIAELRFGKTPPRSEARFWNPPDGHPWATIADLRTDPVLETAETVSEAGLPFAGRSVLPDSIMMSFKLTVGRVARAGAELLTNEAIVSVHGLEGRADDGWLYHALPGIARSGITDTAVKGSTLNKTTLEKLRVYLPPLEEQRRIARVLDTMDESIQATERIIAKLEMRRQALSQAVFGRRSWHSALGVVALGSLLVCPPRNGKSPHEGESWRGAFMLGLGCLTATGFTPRQLKWAPEVRGSLRQALLADGDLLMSRSNTEDRVGFVGRYRNVGHPCIYPDLMMRLVPRTQTSAQYLELALQSGPARRQMRTLASGTSGSMVKITGEAVSSLSVAICSTADQARFCDLFDALSETRNAEELRASKLRDLRAGIAADLLSGQVRTVAA